MSCLVVDELITLKHFGFKIPLLDLVCIGCVKPSTDFVKPNKLFEAAC